MYVGWLMKVIKAQTKHYDCWDNGEIAAFAPQEAYTCFTADYKNKLSSLMRTIPGISKQLRRLDEAITTKFITAVTGGIQPN